MASAVAAASCNGTLLFVRTIRASRRAHLAAAAANVIIRSEPSSSSTTATGSSVQSILSRFLSTTCHRSNNFTTEKMTTEKPNVIFVLGAPGSGKGTQCQNIVDKYGYVHLSAGDLLRAERKAPGSEYGDLIEHHITNGTIVPVAITCSLLTRAMKDSGKTHFLIDGFPRNKDNLDGWNTEAGDKANVTRVLFFNCDEKVCIDRCLQRGAAGSGRSDDNEESLRKRFVTYLNDTMPIIEEFRGKGLVSQIDANRSKEDVFQDVAKAFQEEKLEQ